MNVLNTSNKEHVCTSVIGRNTPDNFRLAKKSNGEMTLQGRFPWQCTSCGMGGEDWRNLQTVELDGSARTSRWKSIRQWFGKLFSK